MSYNKKSASTARKRTTLSLPAKYLKDNNFLSEGSVLDFGCGKGSDADILQIDKYDPFYFPELPSKKYDKIICIYVLNVVSPNDVDEVIKNIQSYLNPDGTSYLAVRRDVAVEGFTSTGTEQYNVKLNLPVIVEKKNK